MLKAFFAKLVSGQRTQTRLIFDRAIYRLTSALGKNICVQQKIVSSSFNISKVKMAVKLNYIFFLCTRKVKIIIEDFENWNHSKLFLKVISSQNYHQMYKSCNTTERNAFFYLIRISIIFLYIKRKNFKYKIDWLPFDFFFLIFTFDKRISTQFWSDRPLNGTVQQ